MEYRDTHAEPSNRPIGASSSARAPFKRPSRVGPLSSSSSSQIKLKMAVRNTDSKEKPGWKGKCKETEKEKETTLVAKPFPLAGVRPYSPYSSQDTCGPSSQESSPSTHSGKRKKRRVDGPSSAADQREGSITHKPPGTPTSRDIVRARLARQSSTSIDVAMTKKRDIPDAAKRTTAIPAELRRKLIPLSTRIASAGLVRPLTSRPSRLSPAPGPPRREGQSEATPARGKLRKTKRIVDPDEEPVLPTGAVALFDVLRDEAEQRYEEEQGKLEDERRKEAEEARRAFDERQAPARAFFDGLLREKDTVTVASSPAGNQTVTSEGTLSASDNELEPPEVSLSDNAEESAHAASLREARRMNGDPDDLCPYCSEPLPYETSVYLDQLGTQLHEMSVHAPTSKNVNARKVEWQRTIDYCMRHEAEVTIIPLGLAAGYPANVDFRALPIRLETPWVRQEIRLIIEQPAESPFYQKAVEDFHRMGRIKWTGVDRFGNQRIMNRGMPGYYGSLGQTIILKHFFNLKRWGHLLIEPNPIQLLSEADFVSMVLVPEAAVLLIMQDYGAEAFNGDAWETAYHVRRESLEYGQWQFREDGQEADGILADIRKGTEELRQSVALSRSVAATFTNSEHIKATTASQALTISDDGDNSPRPSDLPLRPTTPIDHCDNNVLVASSSVPARILQPIKSNYTNYTSQPTPPPPVCSPWEGNVVPVIPHSSIETPSLDCVSLASNASSLDSQATRGHTNQGSQSQYDSFDDMIYSPEVEAHILAVEQGGSRRPITV